MIDRYIQFLDKVFANITRLGLDVSSYKLDHIAFRCNNIEEYEELKKIGIIDYNFISEKIIDGRPITVFEFILPIKYGKFSIEAIELVSPKPGKIHTHGLEHIEFVIPDNLEDFRNKYLDLTFVEKYEKITNKELELNIGDGFKIKFHNKSLLEVLELEKIN